MRRRFFAVAALSLAAACGVADNSSITEPAVERPLIPSASVIASCPVPALSSEQVKTMLLALYVGGSPDENAVRGKFDNLVHQLSIGDAAEAKTRAWDIAEFTLDARDAGKLIATNQQIADVLNAIFCLAGLIPGFGENSFLIYPSDAAQILITADGLAGVNVPANNVTEPTLLTINPLDTPPDLDTKLDVYPFYYDFDISNVGGTGWVSPVIVGVCPPQDLDDDVMANLLLGHQDGTTFEILPEADASFLDCSTAGGSSNVALNVAGDSTIIAASVIGSAGVGGSTDNFSPIAPVDSRVEGSAGVGGTADNFRPRRNMGATLFNLPSFNVCPPVQALVGTAVDPACRPLITFATPLGTPIGGVDVNWVVESGGGSVAEPASCSPFQNPLAADANGVATICWTLGGTPGTNTVVATASAGGDAPLGVNFVYSDGGVLEDVTGIRFTAKGLGTPTVGATGGTFTYDGLAHAGSGTCTPNSLTPVLSYNTVDGLAPVNAGTYTLTVECGDIGDVGDLYVTNTATATITINKKTATATAGSATVLLGAAVPTLPCTVTGLVAGEAGAVTCTTVTPASGTSTAGTFTTTPDITPDDPPNYSVTLVNGTFTVLGYVQVGCFSSPIFSVMPDTKSAQKKGSNLPVKCTLKWPDGTSVANATGKLEFWSINPASIPGTVPPPSGLPGYTIDPAFAPTSNGNYSHALNTGVPFFVIGGAYYIRATWSDGSTTNGYFRIKQ